MAACYFWRRAFLDPLDLSLDTFAPRIRPRVCVRACVCVRGFCDVILFEPPCGMDVATLSALPWPIRRKAEKPQRGKRTAPRRPCRRRAPAAAASRTLGQAAGTGRGGPACARIVPRRKNI